jgi:hypothetical protein
MITDKIIKQVQGIKKRQERLRSFGPVNPSASMAIEDCFDEIELKLAMIDTYLTTELKTVESEVFKRLQEC